MRKHRGAVARCQPSFDFLEQRALLSGGDFASPGPGAMIAPPPTPAVRSEPASLGRPGSGGIRPDQGGWTPETGLDRAPNLEGPPSFGPVSDSLATTLAKGQPGSTEPGPAGPISLDSQAENVAGLTIGVSKGGGQEPGGLGTGLIGPAVSSPSVPVISFLDADSIVSTRLLSHGDASSGGNGLAGNGSRGRLLTLSGDSGASITSCALTAKTHVRGRSAHGRSGPMAPPQERRPDRKRTPIRPGGARSSHRSVLSANSTKRTAATGSGVARRTLSSTRWPWRALSRPWTWSAGDGGG